MTDLYDKTSERFWEKLEWHRNEFDLNCIDWNESFPIDQFSKKNPSVMDLIKEVQDEFKYIMSEFQCSWAINQFIRGGLPMMESYNEKNNTNLQPRQ